LALAKLMLEPYNLLILDEPTNHLDMRSKDILKQALQKYDGTLIVVSHDRHFLQDLVGKLFEFTERKIKQHSGDIQLFLEKKQLDKLSGITKKTEEKTQVLQQESGDSKKLYLQRKEAEKEIRKYRKQVENCEQEIENLEKLIQDAEKLLASGQEIKDTSFYNVFEENKKLLKQRMEDWEIYFAKAEELEEEKEKIN